MTDPLDPKHLIIDVSAFRSVLTATFRHIPPSTDQDPYIWDDWAQFCWETFVERQLPGGLVLTVYGAGADMHGASSRVSYHQQLPTHEVIIMARSGGRVFDVLNERDCDPSELIFEELVAFEDGWFFCRPPFDMVHARRGDTNAIVCLADVKLVACPYD